MLGLERLSKASNAEAQESKLKVITEKHIQSVAKVMFVVLHANLDTGPQYYVYRARQGRGPHSFKHDLIKSRAVLTFAMNPVLLSNTNYLLSLRSEVL